MASAGEAVVAGRRERKKAATRAAISSAALELFLDRGFEAVSIRDIAQHADVAVATVFAHFSGKEALVFDEDDNVARSLVAAVADRGPGIDALAALEDWFLHTRSAEDARRTDADFVAFRQLVDSTPALRQHWRGMWRQHELALANALERTTSAERRLAALAATLVVEGYLHAADDEQPGDVLTLLFQVLRGGFSNAPGSRGLAT